VAYRELDDVLGLNEMAGDVLADARSGKNGRRAARRGSGSGGDINQELFRRKPSIDLIYERA